MIDLLLAVRNLLRNRRRSAATFIALLIGTAAVLLFGGYRKNIEYSMHTAYVRDGGHLQIQHADLNLFGSGNPTRYSIADYEEIIGSIRNDPVLQKLIRVVTPELRFGGIANNALADTSQTVIGLGMVPPDRNLMREWNQFELPIRLGHFALENAAPDAAVVGVGVARILMLCEALKVASCPRPAAPDEAAGEALPADVAALASQDAAPAADTSAAASHPRIDVLASSPGGAPNVVSLQVLEAENQGFKELDDVYLMMQLPQAQKLVYGRAEPKATAIVVQLHDSARVSEAAQRIETLLAQREGGEPLAVLDFRAIYPFFVQTVQMFDTIFGFIFALIGSIVLFTVGNTMSTAVMERTVEIGTIRAMGLRQRGVQRMFVLEGMILGVAGAVAGVLVALVGSAALNRMGLTWLPPGSGSALPLLMLVWGETETILVTTVGLVAIAAASAWWPARRASRLVIVDALRHV